MVSVGYVVFLDLQSFLPYTFQIHQHQRHRKSVRASLPVVPIEAPCFKRGPIFFMDPESAGQIFEC
jgi:hypothetical protein